MKHLHVPLPDTLHAALMDVAKANGESATTLARQAIEDALWRRRQESLRTDLAAYASAVAGTADDLDPELEAAGLDVVLTDGGKGGG
ncbi:MAG: hypothetical protein ACR2J4_11115 [Deinococcus sp.]